MGGPFALAPFGAVMLSTMFALSDNQLVLVMTAAGAFRGGEAQRVPRARRCQATAARAPLHQRRSRRRNAGRAGRINPIGGLANGEDAAPWQCTLKPTTVSAPKLNARRRHDAGRHRRHAEPSTLHQRHADHDPARPRCARLSGRRRDAARRTVAVTARHSLFAARPRYW
jgi:hypothetical protein